MSDGERKALLFSRQRNGVPWHRPPSRNAGTGAYLITATCYEHHPVVGASPDRMSRFSDELREVLEQSGNCHAWSLLPNHYHALVTTPQVLGLRARLGRLHGRSSYQWNGEEAQRGRKVWHAAVETRIKSERHFWATMNYVHHNPTKHAYARSWTEWPWSSAAMFIETVGREEAMRIWRAYPIRRYGKGWDI